MYGLASKMYSGYRINNDSDKEAYKTKQKTSFVARGTYISLEIFVTLLAVLALVDVVLVKKLGTPFLIVILLLYFIPLVGDVIALFIIIYWFVEIRKDSVLLSNLNLPSF